MKIAFTRVVKQKGTDKEGRYRGHTGPDIIF